MRIIVKVISIVIIAVKIYAFINLICRVCLSDLLTSLTCMILGNVVAEDVCISWTSTGARYY